MEGSRWIDPSLSDQSDNALVALLVFTAQVLHQVQDELSTQGLVAVHPRHVAKLGLTCQRHKLET